jgi:hypothetical protein
MRVQCCGCTISLDYPDHRRRRRRRRRRTILPQEGEE